MKPGPNCVPVKIPLQSGKQNRVGLKDVNCVMAIAVPLRCYLEGKDTFIGADIEKVLAVTGKDPRKRQGRPLLNVVRGRPESKTCLAQRNGQPEPVGNSTVGLDELLPHVAVADNGRRYPFQRRGFAGYRQGRQPAQDAFVSRQTAYRRGERYREPLQAVWSGFTAHRVPSPEARIPAGDRHVRIRMM